MKAKPTKPKMAWFVVDSDGDPVVWTASIYAEGSTRKFIQGRSFKTWDAATEAGYCVKRLPIGGGK